MPCLLLIITLLFIRGEMKILAKYQKVSQYYENYYSFVISLFFSLFFFFFYASVLRILQIDSG